MSENISNVEEQLSADLRKKREFDTAMDQPYINDGVLDPNGLAGTAKQSTLTADRVSVLGRDYAKDVDQHLVWDIETYSTNMTELMFGLVQEFDTEEFSPVLKTWKDVTEYFENYLYLNSRGNKNYLCKVWAHNHSNFDGVGLAANIQATEEDDIIDVKVEVPITNDRDFVVHKISEIKTELEFVSHEDLKFSLSNFLDEVDSNTRKSIFLEKFYDALEEFRHDLEADPFLKIFKADATYTATEQQYKKGISLADKSGIKRVRNITVVKEGGHKHSFTWRVEKWGIYAVIFCKMSNGGELMFVDSMWHIKGGLAKHGDSMGMKKGKTPLKNLRPKKWGRAQGLPYDIDDDKNYEQWMMYWRQSITDSDIEYCKQDIKILTALLKTYQSEFMSLFDKIDLAKKLDPLEYLTCNGSAFAGMLAHIGTAAQSQLDYTTVVKHKGRKNWELAQGSSLQKAVETDGVRYTPVPLSLGKSDCAILTNGTFAIPQFYQEIWGHVAHGGRTEAFMLRTPKGKWSATLDATSMYPSIMQDPECRLINTNTIRPLNRDIIGARRIRNYINGNRSGMYMIESEPPTNKQFLKYPVFPVRLSTRSYDNRLTFPNWKGVMRLYVTGEELKYFINNTDVENDNIKIVGNQSYDSELLNYDPMAGFVRKLFKKRMDSRRDNKYMLAHLYKLMMNSSGFGVFGQINTTPYELTINNDDKSVREIDSAIRHLERVAPDWQGWQSEEWEDTVHSKVQLIKAWATDHYNSIDEYETYSGQRKMTVRLPDKVAPFALRPWSYAITAHARVRLHQTICAIDSAGYDVEYCDTDSVHFAVPLEQSQQDIQETLKDSVNIVDDLGGWKFEPALVEPKLLNSGCDVSEYEEGYVINKPIFHCLAPKHYVLTDQKDNVLMTRVKGVRPEMIKMRCALYSFSVNYSNVGDRRGINTQMRGFADLEKNLTSNVKRNYISETKSEPILLKQPTFIGVYKDPESVIEGRTRIAPTYYDYRATIADIQPLTTGVTKALVTYQGLRFNGESYIKWRDQVTSSFRDLVMLDAMNIEDAYFDIIEKLEGVSMNAEEISEELSEEFGS